MRKTWWLAQGIIALILLYLRAQASSDDAGNGGGFIRPPPGRVIVQQSKKPPGYPQQVHISKVGMNEMRISWVTSDHNKKAPSLVEYGKESGNYSNSATGEHTSYTFFFYKSDRIHHAKIGPLDPDTLYYYRCSGIGTEFSFKTPPDALPVEFAVIGDLGQTEWTASTLAHIGKSNYDMLILPGDLSYADTQQPLWDSFGRMVEPYASKRPWMVTEGNHEVESLQHNNGWGMIAPFAAYNARWRMPYEDSNSTSNLYYSFDVAGAVHVVMLGSYASYGVGSEQYKWVAADLARFDRRKTAWLVAVVHAPWYSTNQAHQGEGEQMRQAMEDLLFEAGVDLVFAGHVHAYERFSRIYKNEANPCGPLYITIGDGGNREGLAFNFMKNHKFGHLSLFREASFGHGRLRVINGSHAHWAWHRNDDSDSTITDQVWLQSLACTSPQKDEL